MKLLLACSPLLAACAAGPAATGKTPADIAVVAPGEAACPQPTTAEIAAATAAANAVRSRHGLSRVRGSAALSAVAARHACDMARRGRMTHVGTSTKGPGERVKAMGYRPAITAENIAAGPFSLNQTLQAWAGSSGHLANILIPQVREVGIGQAGNGRTRFWTAIYAAPR